MGIALNENGILFSGRAAPVEPPGVGGASAARRGEATPTIIPWTIDRKR